MDSEILNEEDYKIILRNYSKNGDIKYVSSKYVPLSDKVEGFMGDYFIVEITFLDKNEERTENFFAKSMPTNSEIQGVHAVRRNVYGKEIFFYDFLLKEYEKYNYDTSFAPNCYYCKNNEILIMENLAGTEFKLSEKNKMYDLHQIKAGLKALAMLHSASILYEEEMTKKTRRTFRLNEEYPAMFKENYLNPENDEKFCKPIFDQTVESIIYTVDNNKNRVYKEVFKSYLNSKTILHGLVAKTNFRRATGHGDLWYNNIFFNYSDSKAVNCKLVDFQILRYSHPALDVLLFIHLNSNKEFRKIHLQSLLMYYYETLSNNFAEHGYEISKIFSIDDFKESLKLVETLALFNVLSVGTLIFYPADVMQEMFDSMSETWDNVHLALFKKTFDTRENYRNAMIEAADDFYDSFFRNDNDKKYF